MTNTDKIIEKVKGLLAIAKDKKRDEETKSALLMAQKLMAKYKLDESQVNSKTKDEIIEKIVSSGKVSKWEDEYLASICRDNFQIKVVLKRDMRLKKSDLVFAGYSEDVKLASEVFELAKKALKFHTSNHVKEYYEENDYPRNKSLTKAIKDSYISGFLISLKNNFMEQKRALQEETALIILTPKEVEEHYGKIKDKKINQSPVVRDSESYQKGYEKGSAMAFGQGKIGA